MTPALQGNLTCPACGTQSREAMPTDACLFFWECPSCKAVARPRAGDCCVFCSYGDVACPPIQEQHGCSADRTDAEL